MSFLRFAARLEHLDVAGVYAWPSRFCSSGLGSNRSIWLGPPTCISMMTDRARGREVADAAAGGRSRPVAPGRRRDARHVGLSSRVASASVPKPSVACSKKWRRPTARRSIRARAEIAR